METASPISIRSPQPHRVPLRYVFTWIAIVVVALGRLAWEWLGQLSLWGQANPYDVATHRSHAAIATFVVAAIAFIVSFALVGRRRLWFTVVSLVVLLSLCVWDYAGVRSYRSTFNPQHRVANQLASALHTHNGQFVDNYDRYYGRRSFVTAPMKNDQTAFCAALTVEMQKHQDWRAQQESLSTSNTCQQAAVINGFQVSVYISYFDNSKGELWISVDESTPASAEPVNGVTDQ